MIPQRIQNLFSGTETTTTDPSSTQPEAATQEQKKVDELAADGSLNANAITDQIFYERHPELKGKSLTKNSSLAAEWKQIKSDLVEPRMNAPQTASDASAPADGEGTSAASSSMAADAKGFLDMGAGLLQRSLHGAVDAGKYVRDSGKAMYQSVLGEGTPQPKIAPGTPSAPPTEINSTASSPIRKDPQAKELISNMIGVFETGDVGGDPSTVQDLDSGIISYGKHQCTLSSKERSLEQVLNRYRELSPNSETTQKMEGFMDRVKKQDKTLRHDEEFKDLLRDAGKDPLMSQAQEDVFNKLYWNPAMDAVEKSGIQSRLGAALICDTAVNSGPENTNTILARTQQKLEGKEFTEQEFLKTFADERTKFILAAAERKSANGETKDAEMLQHVASDWRMDFWKGWIDEGNMELKGDLEFKLYKETIHGG